MLAALKEPNTRQDRHQSDGEDRRQGNREGGFQGQSEVTPEVRDHKEAQERKKNGI